MFIIQDSLEKGKDVEVTDKSQMFKVLRWENGYQLVCRLEGGSGVVLFKPLQWCGGEITISKSDTTYTYSGDGNVFLRPLQKNIVLLRLKEFKEAVVCLKDIVTAIPEEYDISEVTEEGNIFISGSGVLPVEVDCKSEELIKVTIGEEDSLMVSASQLVCWSASLTREFTDGELDGLCRFTGEGTIVFCKGH